MKKNKNRLTTFVVLFSSATAIIHIANKIIAASASLKEMLDSNRRNYYKWRFGEIFIQKKEAEVLFSLSMICFPEPAAMNGTESKKSLPWNIRYTPLTFWDADALKSRE